VLGVGVRALCFAIFDTAAFGLSGGFLFCGCGSSAWSCERFLIFEFGWCVVVAVGIVEEAAFLLCGYGVRLDVCVREPVGLWLEACQRCPGCAVQGLKCSF